MFGYLEALHKEMKHSKSTRKLSSPIKESERKFSDHAPFVTALYLAVIIKMNRTSCTIVLLLEYLNSKSYLIPPLSR